MEVVQGTQSAASSSLLGASSSSSLLGASSSAEASVMSFQVGEDANVVGSQDDPVGLVGCRVNVVWDADPHGRWAHGLYPCVVDAFAAGRKAYIISWVSDRLEHPGSII